MDNNTLRGMLKKYLMSKGVKANWVALKIGVSPSFVSHFLAGRKNLSNQKIAQTLAVINGQ